MQRIFRSLLLTACLAAAPLAAQAELYLLIANVPGDSSAKGHENWIRVASADWNVEAKSSWAPGGGAAVGKPEPGHLTLTLPTGTWSQYFLRLITQGRVLPKLVLDATASDGRPLYRITADNLLVTGYGLASPDAASPPMDRLEGAFRSVKIEYYATMTDGRLVTTSVDWNIATGASTPPL